MEDKIEGNFAREVYVFLDKNYRVSRNIRLRWFLDHLYKPLSLCKNNQSCENECGLHIVSVLPSLTDNLLSTCLQLGPDTEVVFVSSAYRFVFGLDLSSSVLRIDALEHYVVIESMLTSLENCLMCLTQTFSPTEHFKFRPDIYVTIFVQWYSTEPISCSYSHDKLMQKVLIQGCQLTKDAVLLIMQKVKKTVYNCRNRKCFERLQAKQDDFLLGILRTGLLALRVLPPNRSSCIVILTDGVVGEPNAASLERVIKQCQGTTTSCSFIHVCSSSNPLCDFGSISNVELMQFISQSTKGKYINTLHIPAGPVDAGTYFQKAMLPWTLHSRKLLHIDEISLFVGSTQSCSAFDLRNIISPNTESPTLIKQKQGDRNVMGDFVTVVSARLREGFEIKSTKITKNSIEMCLVLHWWKNCTDVEYKVSSTWPVSSNRCKVEVYICGTYEFLRDVSKSHDSKHWTRFRKMIMRRFMIFFQDLMHSEHMLQYLYSFADDQTRYSISDSLRQGQTLYYLPPNSTQFELSTQSLHTSTAFSKFWKPILSLDVNVWHKWFHIHRIEAILQHDFPLPDDQHNIFNDGRHHAVQCRVAFMSLVSMLREWCSFVLLENHTYVKFIYNDKNSDKPSSFFIVRLFSKSPASVLKIAFLSGLSGRVRKLYVDELRDRVAALLVSVSGVSAASIKNVSSKRVRHSSKLSPIMKNQRSQHSASDIPCAIILHKPMDQFLVRYSHPPEDYHSYIAVTEEKLRVSSEINDQNVRMRDMQWYLHHCRSVWSLTSTTQTLQGFASHLTSLLRKIRMEEGFRITYSASGVINLAREFPIQNHSQSTDNGNEYCLVQYVIFPPKVQSTSSEKSTSSLESDDEGLVEEDEVGSGKEIIIATEVWVEPQHGCVKPNNPLSSSSDSENSKSFAEFQNNFLNDVSHYGGLNCEELMNHINQHDFGCISNVITLQHLQVMCATENDSSSTFPQRYHDLNVQSMNFGLTSSHLQSTPVPKFGSNYVANDLDKNANYHYHSCVFDLICLLEHSPRIEHLFMTLTEDETCYSASNSVLMQNFHKHLTALCDCCVDLSDHEQAMITQHMVQKCRKPICSKSNQGTIDAPWSCYLKSGENGQIFVLLLPSTYKAFKSLECLFEDKITIQNESLSFCSSEDRLTDEVTSRKYDTNTKSDSAVPSPMVAQASTPEKLVGCASPKNPRRMSIKRLASTTSTSSENITEHSSKALTQRTVSVYVYNCSMKMLVSSLLHGAKNASRIKWSDSLQDHRISVDGESEESFPYTLQSAEFDFPKLSMSSHGLSEISEEAFPLRSSENECLSHFNAKIVELYHKSFVVGVFSAVQSEEKRFVSTDDLQIATDYFCCESVDEIDITEFMFLNSPPVLEFRSEHLKTETLDNASVNLSSDETNADLARQPLNVSIRLNRQTRRKKVASTSAETFNIRQDDSSDSSPVENLGVADLQSHVSESSSFLTGPTPTIPGLSLHRDSAFTNVRRNLVYRKKDLHDSDRMSSSDEETASINALPFVNQEVDRKGTTFPAKQVIKSTRRLVGLEAGWSNLPEFPISLLNVPHSRHFSGTNDQVEKHFLRLLKAHCQCVRGVPCLFYAVNRHTSPQKLIPKVDDNKNDTDSEVEFICESENVVQPSISVNNSIDITDSITIPDRDATTPTMHHEDDNSDIFENVADIHPLFLYMTCTIRDMRSGNVGTVPVKCLPINLKHIVDSLDSRNESFDLSSVKITLDLTWIYFPSITHNRNIADVPDECSVFVRDIKQKIKWLLEDEIISSLRTTEPITSSTLDRVTQHIHNSSVFSNSKTSSVPLQFIFGTDKSKSLLQAEFEKLRIHNHKLKKVDQYYILSLERTFRPILDYFSSKKNFSVEEVNELIESPVAKRQLSISTSPNFCQTKAMGDSHVSLHDGNKTSHEDNLVSKTFASGSSSEFNQQEKRLKMLTKASSSTELVAGSSSIVRRCTSASNMPTALINPRDLDKAFTFDDDDDETTNVVTSPLTSNHQPLRASLSLGKDPKHFASLSVSKGHVMSMPVTPSNVNTEMPVFVYPINKHNCRQNVGVSPASDSSLHRCSQPSWFGSGYEGEESDSNDEADNRSSLQEAYSQLPNFWLIVDIQNDYATVFFHRRSSTRVIPAVKSEHARIYDMVLTNLKSSCKAVNQSLLLQKLHDSLWCHPLLVEEAPENIWGRDDYSSIYRQSESIEDHGGDDVHKPSHSNDYLAATMNFASGHFECACVLEQTILLHHRITVSKSSSGGTVPSALSTVKGFMKNFTVINQKNMFVFQVQDGTVYYCKMQEEAKRPDSCGRRSSVLTDAEHLVQSKDSSQRHHEPDSRLYLKWYGVHTLTEQQQNDLEELKLGIEKKLDETVLEYITLMLCRNTHFKLTAADVHLIQPRGVNSDGMTVPLPPCETISFAVSPKLTGSMPALLYYVHQHLLLFLSIPRYTTSNSVQFLPFSLSGENAKQRFGSSALYLYAESKEMGKKGHGIACIALDYIAQNAIKGNHSSQADANVTPECMEELAKVALVGVDECEKSKPIISVCIWKRGCLNLDALHEKLQTAVHHAACDAVTEHYLELPLTPPNSVKTNAMKTLFDGTEKEDSRFLQSFLHSTVRSSSTRSSKKDLLDDHGSIVHGTSLNQFYSMVLPNWLKYMDGISCPSVLHCSIDCHINLNREQVVHNVYKILSSMLRNSQVLRFSRLSDSDQGWIYTSSAVGDAFGPGNCMQFIIISRNFELCKKSTRSNTASSVALQKFLPHDVTLRPDASPCPQHDMMMSSSYISRQHFVFVTIETGSADVFFYNIANEKAQAAFKQLQQCVKFHTARLNMLEGLTFQKLGLFKHFLTKTPLNNQTSNDLGVYSVDTLARYSLAPYVEKKQQKFSYVDKCFDEFLLNFPHTGVNVSNQIRDKVASCGQQCIARLKQKSALKDTQNQLKNLRRKISGSICTVSVPELQTVLSYARLIHSETAPIMFDDVTCQNYISFFETPEAVKRKGDKTSTVISRTSSFLGSYKKKSGESLNKMPDKDLSLNAKDSASELSEMSFKFIADKFIELYGDQWKGFVKLQAGGDLTKTTKQAQSQDGPEVIEQYRYRFLPGGIILIVFSAHHFYFQVKLYAIPISTFSDQASQFITKNHSNFVAECEKVKKNLDVHRTALDVHLRFIHHYLNEPQSVIKSKCNLRNMLNSLLAAYSPSLDCIESQIYHGTVCHTCSQVTCQDLYRFIISNAVAFKLKTCIQKDSSDVNQNVIFTDEKSDFHMQCCSSVVHSNCGFCQIIFKEDEQASSCLKFHYYLLFSLNRVSNLATNVTRRLPESLMQAGTNLSRRLSEVSSSSNVGKSSEHITNFSPVEEDAFEDAPSINVAMPSYVTCEKNRVEKDLRELTYVATMECYRSCYLWQKLVQLCQEKAYGKTLTYPEFCTLLEMMHVSSLCEYDAKFIKLFTKRNVKRDGFVIKRLLKQFPKMSAVVASPDNTKQYLCILSPRSINLMVVVKTNSSNHDFEVMIVKPLKEHLIFHKDSSEDACNALLQKFCNAISSSIWMSWL